MKRVIYGRHNFVVYDSGAELIVVNKNGSYSNHAHLKRKVDRQGRVDLSTAKTLIDLVLSHKVPHSDYLKVSAMRLSTSDRFKLAIEEVMDRGLML